MEGLLIMYIMQKGTVLPVRCQSMVGEYKQTVETSPWAKQMRTRMECLREG